MSHDLRIAVVPGDGIGVEVTAEAVRALETVASASGRRLRVQHFEWGADHYLKTGITLPADIRVAQEVCRAATPGASAAITLGQGVFGKPWYRSISVGSVNWSP